MLQIKDHLGKSIRLTDRDFVFSGGEASFYGSGSFGYKIYHDPKRVIPENKLKQLSSIADPKVIIPIGFVSSNNNRVGISMKWVKDSYPFARLFSLRFQDKNNIEVSKLLELLESISDTLEFIHKVGCYVGDLNEFNLLINQTFSNINFIDVDSYGTQDFPVTAMSPTIRDRKAKKISAESDWFAFACISFQVLVGIHPYLGHHPNYSDNDLESRMKDDVSYLNSRVTLPDTVRKPNKLPQSLNDWFKDVFVHHKRYSPDFTGSQVIIIKTSKPIFDSSDLEDPVWRQNIIGKIQFTGFSIDPNNGSIEGAVGKVPSNIIGVLNVKDSVFLVTPGKLHYLQQVKLGNKIAVAVKNSWDFLPNSTQIIPNALISNVLGKFFVYLPEKNGCYIIHVKELDGKHILKGKRYGETVSIITSGKVGFEKYEIVFNNYKTYSIKSQAVQQI